MAGAAPTGQRTGSMSVGFGKPTSPIVPGQVPQQQGIDPALVLAQMDPTIAATFGAKDAAEAAQLPAQELVEQAKQAPVQSTAPQAPIQTPHETRPAPARTVSAPTQGLVFPPIPQTSQDGAPEICLVTRGTLSQFSPMFYGTEEERQQVRQILLDWADTERLDAIIFFVATEWYSRKLQKGGM